MESLKDPCTSPDQSAPCAIHTFTLGQKIFMRICLYGFFAIGIIGVLMENRIWGLFYLLAMGFVGIVILKCFCSHCPYARKGKTCLAMPYRVVTLFPCKDHKLSPREKTLFISSLTFAMVFPQLFLWQRAPLFITYWVFCLPTCIVFPAYFCRRCQFTHCPFHPRKLFHRMSSKN